MNLIGRKITAVSVIGRSDALCALFLVNLIHSFLCAEAIVSLALFDKLLRILLEDAHSLRLNVWTYGTADVRTFVPV